ncbi:MAG: hypothetical protein LBQ66_08065 [Planctomycetaceae bacterium]|nr:hypothetical protein [Planctomycetaceae bacterium]
MFCILKKKLTRYNEVSPLQYQHVCRPFGDEGKPRPYNTNTFAYLTFVYLTFVYFNVINT